jgi:hypothetical protein
MLEGKVNGEMERERKEETVSTKRENEEKACGGV